VELLERLVANIEGLRDDLRNGLEHLGESSNCRDAVEPTAPAHDSLELLTASDVASLLRVDLRTLREMRHAGEFPDPIKVGRSLRWPRRVVARFIEDAQP
jgi:predicted DNA-binding transcriptional regulator AlpA